MKKLILVVWFSYAMSNAMEADSSKVRWEELPIERKTDILTLVIKLSDYHDVKNLLLVNSEIKAITQDILQADPDFMQLIGSIRPNEYISNHHNYKNSEHFFGVYLSAKKFALARFMARWLIRLYPQESAGLFSAFIDNITHKNSWDPMDNLKAMELYLQAGFNINQKSSCSGYAGNHFLVVIVGWLNKELTKLLLDHGADPNHEEENGDTPLLVAVEKSCLYGGGTVEELNDIIQLILDHGANPFAINKKGTSALSIAQSADAQPVIKLFTTGYSLKNRVVAHILKNFEFFKERLDELPGDLQVFFEHAP
jgi:hypothetical protein